MSDIECPIHKDDSQPDCNKCMKLLVEMVTKANGLLISEDGDIIN